MLFFCVACYRLATISDNKLSLSDRSDIAFIAPVAVNVNVNVNDDVDKLHLYARERFSSPSSISLVFPLIFRFFDLFL